MQLPDLPSTQEAQSKSPIEFTVKPTGEFNFRGIPDPEIVRQLVVSSDFHQSQNRKAKSEAEVRADNSARITNIATVSFLGLSFSVLFVCIFLNLNRPTEGGNNNGRIHGFDRRYCP